MTTPIDPGLFTTQLLTLLEETFAQVHGAYLDKGTSFGETLALLSAEEASRAARVSGTTIAGHAAHVHFYLKVIRDYIDGVQLGRLDWKQSWLTHSVTAAEWDALRQEVKQDYENLTSRLKEIDDWNDERRLGGALATLTHTAYHLGAIRQIMHATRQR